MRSARAVRVVALAALLAGAGCGGNLAVKPPPPADPHTDPTTLPTGVTPGAQCAVPAGAGLEDVTAPAAVVGTGTPESCTGEAFVTAVEQTPGVITFACGPDPVTLTVPRTARVFNRVGGRDVERVVIDGGGKITLSGAGARRILYMNTCDESLTHTTSHCQDQQWPQLTVQNLTFVDGNAAGQPASSDPRSAENGSGGAIYARGGRFKAVNARFFHNGCELTGPDVGGGAIRLSQPWQGLPAYVVGCTFGGSEALANYGSNGAALSSIGVSWTVVNSVFVGNHAVGWGANPQRSGSPGGGSGGAIYNDGNTMTLSLCGVTMTGNTAREGGGAVFFVSNNHTGHVVLTDSTLTGNTSDGGWDTRGFPGIFYLGSAATPTATNSTIQ